MRGRATGAARALVRAGLLTLALAGPALAQGGGPSRFAVTDYEGKLMRFVEVIGSVQYLRQLCAPAEGTQWRERAAAIIEAEGDTEARRAQLTAAFNRGYRAFSGYLECNDAAIYAIDLYMREGASLGQDILLRYGE